MMSGRSNSVGFLTSVWARRRRFSNCLICCSSRFSPIARDLRENGTVDLLSTRFVSHEQTLFVQILEAVIPGCRLYGPVRVEAFEFCARHLAGFDDGSEGLLLP